MDTLYRGQRHTEGRGTRGKQPPTGISLHHGDPHISLFTQLIELGTVRVNAAQPLQVVLRGKIVVHILAGRKQIERRVDAEQEHLDLPAQGGQDAHLGIVGAQANVADDPLGLLFLHISQELSLHNAVELSLLVYKVDHTQINVVGPQPAEQVLEGRLHLVHVPGSDILTILPGGTEVPLDDPALPLPSDG